MSIKQNILKKSLSKTRKIGEILGMLAETRRDKDWVLKEIKKRNLKISNKTFLNSYDLLNSCTDSFVTNLYRVLKGENVQGFEGVQSLTKTYHWLLTDIVGDSDPTTPTREQVRKINVLNELMARTETFRSRDVGSTIIETIGDGVAIGFSDSPEKPLRLAIEFHKALYRYNESRISKENLFVRMGIDMGPVYFVKDLNGKDTVWGPGIILSRRVVNLCGDMNIFASSRIAEDIRKLSPQYEEILHSIGTFGVKHGEELAIYNIYGEGFGNKVFPRKKKVVMPNEQRNIRLVNNFAFNEIGLKLEILDPKSMLTHHTWIWNVVNVSKTPMSQIFYYLDGDIPKEFNEMNVTVHDDKNNLFEILAVNENRPYHKEFVVQLNRPLKLKMRRKIILEYDWEDKDRSYVYRFASGCRKFNFSFLAPKGSDMKVQIFEIDEVAGSKTRVKQLPTIVEYNDKTGITWTKNDLKASESYQFEW